MRRKRIAIIGSVAALALLFGLLVAWWSKSRFPFFKDEVNCRKGLSIVGFGLRNYYRAHGQFPPAYVSDANGKPMHSWRVLILPYMDEKELYDHYDFSEPWDGPHNRLLADKMPVFYRCPYSADRTGTMTNYVAVVGKDTAWPGSRGTVPAEFVAEGACTISLVEMADSGICWLEPRDLVYDEVFGEPNSEIARRIKSGHPDGQSSYLFVWGNVRRGHLSIKELRDMLSRGNDNTGPFNRDAGDSTPGD